MTMKGKLMTIEDWKNIQALIAAAPITGAQSMTVVILQQKIQAEIVALQAPQPATLRPNVE